MSFDFVFAAWSILGAQAGPGRLPQQLPRQAVEASAPAAPGPTVTVPAVPPSPVPDPAAVPPPVPAQAMAPPMPMRQPPPASAILPGAPPAAPAPTRGTGLEGGMGGGLWRIHLASYRQPENAERDWAVYRDKAPEVLGALQPYRDPVDVPGKGHFIRLYAGPFESRAAAEAACQSLHRHRLYCVINDQLH